MGLVYGFGYLEKFLIVAAGAFIRHSYHAHQHAHGYLTIPVPVQYRADVYQEILDSLS